MSVFTTFTWRWRLAGRGEVIYCNCRFSFLRFWGKSPGWLWCWRRRKCCSLRDCRMTLQVSNLLPPPHLGNPNLTRYRKYDGDCSCAYRELLTPLREPGGPELSSKTTPAAADVNTNQLLVTAVNLQMFPIAAILLRISPPTTDISCSAQTAASQLSTIYTFLPSNYA